MTENKKLLLKNIALTLVGIIPALIFDKSKNWGLIILKIFGVIVAGLNFIFIFINLQSYLDDLFPKKTYHQKSVNAIDNYIYNGINIVFFIATIFMLTQINQIDNTLHGSTMFWNSILFCILFSLITIFILSQKSKTLHQDSNRSYTVILGVPLIFIMLVPALANFINRQFADKQITCKEYLVKSIGESTKGKQPFVNLIIDSSDERFAITRDFYEAAIDQEKIVLCTRKGLLGYEYVSQFKIQN